MWQWIFRRPFKKRYAWIFLACLLAVILPALLLVSLVTGSHAGDRVLEIAKGKEASRQAVMGHGINLAGLGADNLLIHGSFEPLVYRKDLLVAGGDSSSLLIASGDQLPSPRSEIPLDSFFDGASFSVMSNRGGQVRVKHSGQVISCLPEQISAFHNYDLPLETSPALAWRDLLEQDEKIYVGGTQGYLLAQLRGDVQVYQTASRQDILHLAPGTEGPLALDSRGQIYLLGSQGLQLIYLPPAEAKPQVKELFKDLASLTGGAEEEPDLVLLVLNGQGQVFRAQLPYTFFLDQKQDHDPQLPVQPDTGEKALLEHGAFRQVGLPAGQKARRIFQDANNFYLLTQDQALYQSTDGLAWEEMLAPLAGEEALARAEVEELPATDEGQDQAEAQIKSPAWLSLSTWQGKLLLAGEQGRILLWDTLTDIKLPLDPRLLAPQGPLPDLVDGMIISDRHLLLVDAEGALYESLDAGESWELRKEGVQRIFLSSDDNLIVATSSGQLASAILGVQILTDPPLPEGAYAAGDLLRLEQQSPLPWARIRQHELEARSSQDFKVNPPAAEAGDWYHSSQAKVRPVLDQSPALGGRACLFLQTEGAATPSSDPRGEMGKSEADSENQEAAKPHQGELLGIYSGSFLADAGKQDPQALRLSQPLTAEALGLMQGNSAFELSFWARADNAQAYVDVDLTGPNMPSDPVRRYLTEEWAQYSVLFIIPWSVAENSDLRLNFDFSQGHSFYLDAARLGKADRNTPYQEDLRLLAKLKPDILRLSYLPLGQAALPSEYYLAQEGQYLFTDEAGLSPVYAGTLRQALEVVEEAQASPWLCISSSINETELRHLMQYLFGSRQSAYGLKRLQDGSISRWNELFTTIYLEFTEDQFSSFSTDRERSALVDWAIEVISSTPEYDLVSHQLVFIDGMNYQEGSLLSSADAHAADYGPVLTVGKQAELEAVSEARLAKLLRDPLRLGATRPELYRSVAAGESQRLADYLAQILQGLGREVLLALPDMSGEPEGVPRQLLTSLNQACQGLAGHTPYEVKITGYEEGEDKPLLALVFADREETRTYVLNLGEEVELFRLRDAVPDQSQIWEYDWDGRLLVQETMGWRPKTFTILPGAVLVMSTPLQP